MPKKDVTASCTAGIRVDPPTRMTSSMSLVESPAALRAVWQGSMVRLTSASVSCSNLERLMERTRCFGTPSTGMM